MKKFAFLFAVVFFAAGSLMAQGKGARPSNFGGIEIVDLDGKHEITLQVVGVGSDQVQLVSIEIDVPEKAWNSDSKYQPKPIRIDMRKPVAVSGNSAYYSTTQDLSLYVDDSGFISGTAKGVNKSWGKFVKKFKGKTKFDRKQYD